MNTYHKTYSLFLILILSYLGLHAQQKDTTYQLILGGSAETPFENKEWISIETYLNNNSNDTLYYVSNKQVYSPYGCANQFFSLVKNPYFHLRPIASNNTAFVKASLPPHRSQKMRLYLTADQEPEHKVALKFTLNLYKWPNDIRNKNNPTLIEGLSDETLIYYDNKYGYQPMDHGPQFQDKQSKILLDKDLHLLTESDRKLYTLSVNKRKIAILDSTAYIPFKSDRKKSKVIRVPVILHNNSADTLKFYSMSCSWYDFFGTDDKDIDVDGWGCEKNIPEIITVIPGGQYERDLSILYPVNIKKGTNYRITMSLIKVNNKDIYGWHLLPTDYTRFNKIYSNEITVP